MASLLIYLLVFGALFFGVSYLMTRGTLSVELRTSAATVGTTEGEVALVPYQRNGAVGMISMITQDTFQVRLAAVNVQDGELLWDVQLTDELSGDGVVLAATERYSYVATDHGLVILETLTGDTVAKGAEIDGLGERAVLATSAYGYDQRTNAIVALDTAGGTHVVPVGSTRARPATKAVAAAHQGWVRSDDPFDDTVFDEYDETAESIDTENGRTFALRASDTRLGRSRLEISSPSGGPVVRGPEFVDPSIVLEIEGRRVELDKAGTGSPDVEPTFEPVRKPAGEAQGVVLVQHHTSVHDGGYHLSVLDAESGVLLDRVAMGGEVSRALSTESGATVLFAAEPGESYPDQLLVVNAGDVARRID